MRAPQVSPTAYRRLTLVNVVVLLAIIVSGAIVRLTDSGLGCDNWPRCSETKFVDVASSHAAIEQWNRLFSGLILIPLGLALLGAYFRRPRRNDLVALSWVVVGLFFMNAVLGGISVLVELAWTSVMLHFLLAITLLGVALLTHWRAGLPDDAHAVPVVAKPLRILAYVVYALTIWVLVWGTLVTAAGPHGGDADARRLGWGIGDVARVHAISVDVLVVLVLVLIVALVRAHAPRRVLTAASCALAVMAAQGVLGYVQYANEIPEVLVGFHVFGASLVFLTVTELILELRAPRTEPVLEAADATPVSVARGA